MHAETASSRDVRTIHRDHATFVWHSLQRLGVRDAELDDALQDVFIVVHRRLASFDGTSKLTTWLYGICLRVAAASRRRASERHEVLTGDLAESSRVDAGPEVHMQTQQSAQLVQRILDELDIEKRAIFVMFELDQLACSEIADIVGAPLGTVHSRLRAARIEFEERLKRQLMRDDRGVS